MAEEVVTGFVAYHAVPTNLDVLAAFRYHIMVLWMPMLTRAQPVRTVPGGTGSTGSRPSGCPSLASFIPGPTSASPSNIQGGSRHPLPSSFPAAVAASIAAARAAGSLNQ